VHRAREERRDGEPSASGDAIRSDATVLAMRRRRAPGVLLPAGSGRILQPRQVLAEQISPPRPRIETARLDFWRAAAR